FLGAFCLYVFWVLGWAELFTPMRFSEAFDYFTLPRCGLAFLNGTSLYSSSADFSFFGPHATQWASHPALCFFFGIPSVFLSEDFGFHFFNLFYLSIHLFIIWSFGKKITYRTRKDAVFFFFLGFFFPWAVAYHLGQYHVFAVLALALVLLKKETW